MWTAPYIKRFFYKNEVSIAMRRDIYISESTVASLAVVCTRADDSVGILLHAITPTVFDSLEIGKLHMHS